MPIPVVSQNPAIEWDEILYWPDLDSNDVAPAAPGNPVQRYLKVTGDYHGLANAPREMSRTNSALNSGFTFRADVGGLPYFRGGSGGGAVSRLNIGFDGMHALLDIGTGFPRAAGTELASWCRVWWLKWWMADDDPNPPNRRVGLIVQPFNNAAAPAWPDEPVGGTNHGGFGFNGDGASWQYCSYDRAGVALARELVALPAHNVTDWNQFEIVLIGERPGIPATAEFYFNGAQLFTRNWTAGLLEPYAANEWRFMPVLGSGDPGAPSNHVCITQVECRKGRFTRAGVEL